MGKRSRRRGAETLKAPESEYRSPEGDVLALPVTAVVRAIITFGLTLTNVPFTYGNGALLARNMLGRILELPGARQPDSLLQLGFRAAF